MSGPEESAALYSILRGWTRVPGAGTVRAPGWDPGVTPCDAQCHCPFAINPSAVGRARHCRSPENSKQNHVFRSQVPAADGNLGSHSQSRCWIRNLLRYDDLVEGAGYWALCPGLMLWGLLGTMSTFNIPQGTRDSRERLL